MLREKFSTAMKEAMRSKERRRLTTIRLIMAAIKDRDISVRTESDSKVGDPEIIDILSKMVKQRNDSIKAYEDAGRLELAKQESDEINIIREFLRSLGLTCWRMIGEKTKINDNFCDDRYPQCNQDVNS